jgi:ribosomal protein L37AE/L43A
MSESSTESLAPYRIEPARSARSKCKACRRAIPKGALRFGFLIEGPFGPGYLWHHMNCAARRHLDKLEEAYARRCWEDGVRAPSLETLRAKAEHADRARKERKNAPYVERAPTGRAACKQCGESIAKDSFRVVMLRSVEFGGQVRRGPVNVHPGCVAAEMQREDCAIEPDGFEVALRANSEGIDTGDLDRVLDEIGNVYLA